MGAKDELLDRIPELSEDTANDLLDYLNLLLDPDEASEEDLEAVRIGREAISRGEGLDLDAVRRLLTE